MNSKPVKEKYVTDVVFKKEVKGLHEKIDNEVKGLHKKIDNVAVYVINMDERLKNVEETMATKSDINLILNRFDYFTKKVSEFDLEERVQSFQIVETKHKVEDHEKRLVQLEAAR